MEKKNIMGGIKDGVVNRVKGLQIRTWLLTLSMLVVLVIYFFINAQVRDSISWVDFGFIIMLQVIMSSTYFENGKKYGEKDPVYIANRQAYNDKASKISELKAKSKLRAFCDVDYKRRLAEYIDFQCTQIGIEQKHLPQLKKMTPKQIDKLERLQIGDNEVTLTKKRKKLLKSLLFKPLPVERNDPDTILEAMDHDTFGKIKDRTSKASRMFYTFKLSTILIFGLAIGYVALSGGKSFGIEEMFRLSLYLVTLVSAGVSSFTVGESVVKVNKTNFYISLIDFLDEFFEWNEAGAIDNIPGTEVAQMFATEDKHEQNTLILEGN